MKLKLKSIIHVVACIITNTLFSQNLEVSYQIQDSILELKHKNLDNYPVQILDPFKVKPGTVFHFGLLYKHNMYSLPPGAIYNMQNERFLTIKENQTLILRANFKEILQSITNENNENERLNFDEILAILAHKNYRYFNFSYYLYYKSISGDILNKNYVLESIIQ
ncbi:hypothetical protein [Formosa sp. S-31]|uniref:hypothetical protein n=1 Tax=Formosa sp. S-31 TaxID=2790949 RepID=UPI003EBE0373